MEPKYLELDNQGRAKELLDLSASELNTGIEAKYWHFYALWRLNEADKAFLFLSENEEEINSHPKWAARFKLWEAGLNKKGGIRHAIELFKNVIQLNNELGDRFVSGHANLAIGYQYSLLGDYGLSIDYSHKAIKILENSTEVARLGLTYINLGKAYAQNGDFEASEQSFEKGLDLCASVGNIPFRIKGCYYLINELENNTSQDSIEKYVVMVREIAKNHSNPLILTLNDYCQAVYLKMSKRNRDKTDAERIFIKIIEESKIDYDINLYSMFHLLELLLIEYRTYKEDVVLDEIEKYISQMYEISTKKKMYLWIVRSTILQSRLFAIKGKLQNSFKLLEDILIFIKQNKLSRYEEYINDEKNRMDSQFAEMKQMIEENNSISSRIDKMQLLSYLQMAKKKVSGST